MVKIALETRVIARLIEKPWRICGGDTLAQSLVNDKSNPWYGTLPIPPIMDQQLDQIVIRKALAHRGRRVLSLLKDKVYNREHAKENDLDIFLTMVILLSNCGAQLAHARAFARRYGFTVRENANTSFF